MLAFSHAGMMVFGVCGVTVGRVVLNHEYPRSTEITVLPKVQIKPGCPGHVVVPTSEYQLRNDPVIRVQVHGIDPVRLIVSGDERIAATIRLGAELTIRVQSGPTPEKPNRISLAFTSSRCPLAVANWFSAVNSTNKAR